MDGSQIPGYAALDRWMKRRGLTPTGFARRYGFNDRDFRRLMQLRDRRKFSIEFVERVHLITNGEVDRKFWIPI